MHITKESYLCSHRGRFGISRKGDREDDFEDLELKDYLDKEVGQGEDKDKEKDAEEKDLEVAKDSSDSSEATDKKEKKESDKKRTYTTGKKDKGKGKDSEIRNISDEDVGERANTLMESRTRGTKKETPVSSSVAMVMGQVQKDQEMQKKYKLPVEDIILLGMCTPCTQTQRRRFPPVV